jgi:hypothetical protein
MNSSKTKIWYTVVEVKKMMLASRMTILNAEGEWISFTRILLCLFVMSWILKYDIKWSQNYQ